MYKYTRKSELIKTRLVESHNKYQKMLSPFIKAYNVKADMLIDPNKFESTKIHNPRRAQLKIGKIPISALTEIMKEFVKVLIIIP
jgi:endonuclease IV